MKPVLRENIEKKSIQKKIQNKTIAIKKNKNQIWYKNKMTRNLSIFAD